MKKYSDRTIEQVGGAIVSSFTTLHFLEEVKHTGLFKQRLRKNLQRTIDDLIDVERIYFYELEKEDDKDFSDTIVANKLDFIKLLLNDFTFNDFTKMQEVMYAYKLDKVRLTDLSDEILADNGAKKEEI